MINFGLRKVALIRTLLLVLATASRSNCRRVRLLIACAASEGSMLLGVALRAIGVAERLWRVRLTCLAVTVLFVLVSPFLAHSDDIDALHDQVSKLHEAGRFAEALVPAQRALELTESRHGRKSHRMATALGNLGLLQHELGRSMEAEHTFGRALVVLEQTLGPEHAEVATVMSNLARVYRKQGRTREAESFFKRALAIGEKATGPGDPSVATMLNNIAELYFEIGKHADAEVLYRRALKIRETAFGRDSLPVAMAAGNLANLLLTTGRLAEAKSLREQEFSVISKLLPPEHPHVTVAQVNLGTLYALESRYADAEKLFTHAVSTLEKVAGPSDPRIAVVRKNIADVYRMQGRNTEAETLYTRLTAQDKSLAESVDVLASLASIQFAQKQWGKSVEFLERAAAISTRRARSGAETTGQPLAGNVDSETVRRGRLFHLFIKAAFRLAEQNVARKSELMRASFEMAQWARGSETASSLLQMTARQAKGDTGVARLVRERQDLVAEWQMRDRLLLAALSQQHLAKRNPVAEEALRKRLSEIETRVQEIDRALVTQFPEFPAFANPDPLSITSVQGHLSEHEALVLFVDTLGWESAQEETFVWVITKSEANWTRSDLGSMRLALNVMKLRCGLDREGQWAWDPTQQRWEAKEEYCKEYRPQGFTADERPPFDVALAQTLYRSLLGGVRTQIKDKHLLVVPSGALTLLPMQVLVTDSLKREADNEPYKGIAWLARTNAITVLPAVSSLRALRQQARATRAGKPYLGIGNPLLEGPDGTYSDRARLARETQRCGGTLWQRIVGVGAGRNKSYVPQKRIVLNPVDVRASTPLPETADELCMVAKSLGAADDDVRLGATATESELKRLSSSGALAGYRILHLATHGALAGEIRKGAEPGLILTPPAIASSDDDGYLSASEIAMLRLDAEWVIVSACNTAAGRSENDEALSGIARAFLYAGARALLVSHWAVDSLATVELITKAVGAMALNKRLGRSEALRHAMLALIDSSNPVHAHPGYWAPFVVVGEGAR